MLMIYFCSRCWEGTDIGVVICKDCGHDLTEFLQLPYDKKLLLALRHPTRQRQLLAIQLLGQIRNEEALPEYKRLLQEMDDYLLLREVLLALDNLPDAHRKPLLQEAMHHRAHRVGELARRLLLEQKES